MSISLINAVSATAYPGRGIIVGQTTDRQHAILAYFIMGRSENSRNRIFVEDGPGIRTQAFDPSKMQDPSLIIYAPVRVLGHHTIVTNGNQTDTIYDCVKEQGNFSAALRMRTFEPDVPNYTPRVSVMTTICAGAFSYQMSILKSADAKGTGANRFFFEYNAPTPGLGHFIHTYAGDGDPLPPFRGEPTVVVLEGGLDDITNAIWRSLNEENKVSLWTRAIDLSDLSTESRIINKNA